MQHTTFPVKCVCTEEAETHSPGCFSPFLEGSACVRTDPLTMHALETNSGTVVLQCSLS